MEKNEVSLYYILNVIAFMLFCAGFLGGMWSLPPTLLSSIIIVGMFLGYMVTLITLKHFKEKLN